MFDIKDLIIEKIVSCDVCDAEGNVIGKTTRFLNDDNESICHYIKNNDNKNKK